MGSDAEYFLCINWPFLTNDPTAPLLDLISPPEPLVSLKIFCHLEIPGTQKVVLLNLATLGPCSSQNFAYELEGLYFS